MWGTRLTDPIADPEWLAFLDASPSAEIFHHPEWLELLRSQYGYQIQACCTRDEHGAIEAGIPIARIESHLTGRRLVSLPFSDTCAPAFAPTADADTAVALGKALADECRRTGLGLTIHASMPGAPGAFVQLRFVRHLLALATDPVEVAQGYSKSNERNIKKAKREGLRMGLDTDTASLERFYWLHLKTRQRLGAPTQPRRFIRGFERLFAAGLGFVATVFDGPRPIAAGVFLTYNGKLTYKYGASDAHALGKRPNNLLFSEVIRWGCEAGFHSLDFGRTEVDNRGLRAFKRSWGAAETGLPYTYLAERKPLPQTGLRERMVHATIRHSPATVSRLAGEALYRHYG